MGGQPTGSSAGGTAPDTKPEVPENGLLEQSGSSFGAHGQGDVYPRLEQSR